MNFSLANLIGGFLCGVIGFAAFRYGKATLAWRPMLIGGILMIFPYFIDDVAWLYVIGIALTAALFVFREN